ncbi:hypothetical protein ACFYUL_11840 [Streptomyces sp. NPDC004311]|uniref:hypothetical protein n=1 Tax=Streptomyces sp. NPDC004311 TaxID=3364698 RepID=UPI0036BE76D2
MKRPQDEHPDEEIDDKERTRRAGLNPVRPTTAPQSGESAPDERSREADHSHRDVPHDEDS